MAKLNPKFIFSALRKKKVAAFCKKHHIVYFAFFGSILTPKFKRSSDIDILVEFHKKHIPGLFNYVGMEFELAEIMGRRVDLKTPKELSQFFRDEVLAAALVVHEI
ncbi:MAG: nucleotidyltransferase family protein [Verrucomicrobia bacterium]|nr:nucleotidyltransferase family protein [Verrucomicrobiota bacterium]